MSLLNESSLWQKKSPTRSGVSTNETEGVDKYK